MVEEEWHVNLVVKRGSGPFVSEEKTVQLTGGRKDLKDSSSSSQGSAGKDMVKLCK